jgi:hypothetical protein
MAFDEMRWRRSSPRCARAGQQVPIEVVAREGGYGLISGLRRVMALREIGEPEFWL